MTNWLLIFLALYILVWQPAIVWWMINSTQLYQLAWLNAIIFVIALIISAICKPKRSKENTMKLVEKSEEKISRIENEKGVAVVEMEKKAEVVMESNNEKQELDTQSTEEIEEKSEEKIPERPMKETVTIPKIVQPITWHSTSKKRKKEVKWGQRLILLLTLGLAIIIIYTLWEFLENRWICIALFLWRILYLIIGKLFDVNWFFNAKKLFTNRLYILMIIAWIAYWIYASQGNNSFNLIKDKATSYIKELLNSEDENDFETNTWDIIYVFEWTWEIINNTENETNIFDETWSIESESWMIENIETETWIIENIQPEIETQQEIIAETPILSTEEAKKQVTMWEAIKSLLAWATLSTKTNISFKYVSKSNELYPYFKTAQEKWMIGTDTDPSKIVSCETYITLKWLREWWNVWNYTKDNVKSVYWNKAEALWKLNWCKKWAYVTKGNL